MAALSLETVKGFRDFVEGKAEHVSGLSATNARTIRFDLTTPLSVLPIVLSSPMMSVVDPETIEGDLADLDLSGSWQVVESDDGTLLYRGHLPLLRLSVRGA